MEGPGPSNSNHLQLHDIRGLTSGVMEEEGPAEGLIIRQQDPPWKLLSVRLLISSARSTHSHAYCNHLQCRQQLSRVAQDVLLKALNL